MIDLVPLWLVGDVAVVGPVLEVACSVDAAFVGHEPLIRLETDHDRAISRDLVQHVVFVAHPVSTPHVSIQDIWGNCWDGINMIRNLGWDYNV